LKPILWYYNYRSFVGWQQASIAQRQKGDNGEKLLSSSRNKRVIDK